MRVRESEQPGNRYAAPSPFTKEVTMNTDMPQDQQFIKQYQKHLKCLKLGGLQPKTIDAYARAIRRIGNYFDCRIDNLSSDQLLDYFTELLDTHSWSAVKLDLYGLKFFYSKVLGKSWEDIPLVKPPKTSRIPDILSIEQARKLFAATSILSYKVFFFTCYSMGLRLGEGIRLTVGDIDAGTMRVHIRDAKGNKDRLVPLPDKTLRVLREFWAMHKHPRFLFPSRKRGLRNAHLVDLPLDRSGIQTAMQAVVKELGIKKNLMPLPAPQLRHPLAGGRS
jgi:integrase